MRNALLETQAPFEGASKQQSLLYTRTKEPMMAQVLNYIHQDFRSSPAKLRVTFLSSVWLSTSDCKAAVSRIRSANLASCCITCSGADALNVLCSAPQTGSAVASAVVCGTLCSVLTSLMWDSSADFLSRGYAERKICGPRFSISGSDSTCALDCAVT